MNYTKNWGKSVERYKAFWQGEMLDRCCVSVTAPKRTLEPLPSFTSQETLEHWTDGEWVFKTWKNYFESTYFAGDAFPNLWLNLGPSGHAGYIKDARCKFMQGSGLNCTTWYDHSIHDWDTDFPVFDPNGFLYKKTLELANYLASENKGEVMVSMPDNAGNLDALACLRGTGELLIDFIEEKETVLRAGKVMQSVWEQAVTDVYQILKDNKFMGGILVDQFYDNPGKLSETIEMNLRRADGLMVFDIVHIIQKNLWKEIEKGMREGGAI